MLEQPRVGGGALEKRTLGRDVAEEREQAAVFLEGFAGRSNHRAIDKRRPRREPIAERLAGHGAAAEMQHVLQLVQHPAGAKLL